MAFPVLDFVGTFIGKKPTYPLVRRKNWNTEVVKYDSSFIQTNELYTFPIREWELHHKLLTSSQEDKFFELFDSARGQGRRLYLLDPNDYEGESSWTQVALTITAVDQSDDYFTVTDQHASKFQVGWKFKVTGSTGNDDIYTVQDISQDESSTYIYVEEDIPSSVGNGTILRMYFQLYNTYYSGEDYEFSEPKKDIVPNQCTVEVNSVEKTEGVDYTLSDTEGVIMFVSDSTPTNGQTIEAAFQFYYRVMFSSDSISSSRIWTSHYNPGIMTLIEVKRRTTEL